MQKNKHKITLSKLVIEEPPCLCGNCQVDLTDISSFFIDGEEIEVCMDCMTRHFRNCDYCEILHRNGDVDYITDIESYYCEYCRECNGVELDKIAVDFTPKEYRIRLDRMITSLKLCFIFSTGETARNCTATKTAGGSMRE